MNRLRLVLVGGFLGAGKTTLIAEAAKRLMAQGKRVGVITNDQAEGLVDTGFLARSGVVVDEVSGGCFCCKFTDLEAAALKLANTAKPDVLLGEPVGSCTDISATVIQPIKWLWGEWAEVAPFTVLADPRRLTQALNGNDQGPLPENVLYIFRKQLEEADAIVISKADLLSPGELARLRARVVQEFPKTEILELSTVDGTGVEAWMDFVLTGSRAGRSIVDVDYDTYADGEAALGWLNASITLTGPSDTDWAGLALRVLQHIQSSLVRAGSEIAHLKVLVTTVGGSAVANVTTNAEEPSIRGTIAGPSDQASLTVNARVHTDPTALREAAEAAVQAVCTGGVHALDEAFVSLQPGYPMPKHRFEQTVEDGGRPR